ncbi:YheC/YheD family protein [Cohnella caldifontis]|uniref:YheC/YheD family protein n=1 Tax=Cohnella caldifontis TaxID=3027471 RepID=UPI0023EBAC00|nr:YheC/YheD family protein [Cohnella sp. YIM B05605]
MRKRGKYAYAQIMKTDPFVRSSIPDTKFFTGESFNRMINRYGTVIVKPNWGLGGAGVIKVSRRSSGKYLIHVGTNRRVFSSQTAALDFLRPYTSRKPYIVQRYISMCRVKGRPFDLRIMVQRKKGVPWTITGKLAKVAGPNRIITNTARSKGYVLPAISALTHTFSKSRSKAILNRMEQICLRAARKLGMAYGIRTYGFDMAVDRKGNTWVFEANEKPAIAFFKRLKDKSYYHQILATAPTTQYHRHFTGKI